MSDKKKVNGTTIYIPTDLLEKIKELKIIPDESYYRVIERLINKHNDMK